MGTLAADRKGKESKSETKKAKTGPPPKEVLGSGLASKAADILKNRRREQMEELGLKDGGKVKRKAKSKKKTSKKRAKSKKR